MEVGCCRNYFPIISSKIDSIFKIFVFLISLIVIGNLPPGVHGKLTIAKECGEIVCKPHNYCSQVDHSCRPCQIACDPALGNYDQTLCEKDCQDYLHDLWYMRRPENETGPSFRDELYIDLYYQMQEDLRLLKILIGVVIILSTVVMLALFAIMVYFKRLRNKLNSGTNMKKKRAGDYPIIYSNSKVFTLPDLNKGPPSHISSSINNNMSRGSSPDLVSRSVATLNASFPTHQQQLQQNPSKNSVITNTHYEKQHRLRKEPSESTLPEYHAYDNPALVPSPIHHTHM